MSYLSAIVIVIGLFIFESVASIDNVIINADILATMKPKYRKWFLIWGIILSVFLVRGLLPWLILWITNPTLGPIEIFIRSLNSDLGTIEDTAPYLLMFGGMFMLFLFCYWLFCEKKKCIVPGERYLTNQTPWYYVIVTIVLLIIVCIAIYPQHNHLLAFSAVAGSTLFFLIQGFRLFADKKTAELGNSESSESTKLLMLVVIDSVFSIDSVIGAFAFTFSIPLIFIGCGLGAIVVRELTIKYVNIIKRYIYLKNGAMYSVFMLSIIMICGGFGIDIPNWIATALMIVLVSFFFFISIKRNRRVKAN